MQIHQSAEDYLETILMLSQRMGKVRSIDVVNELGFTKASVSIAMKKLRENGYIAVDGEGNLTLLAPGREIAERIYGRHRLLTHFFMQLGVDEKTAAEDACKAEHILSEQQSRYPGFYAVCSAALVGCFYSESLAVPYRPDISSFNRWGYFNLLLYPLFRNKHIPILIINSFSNKFFYILKCCLLSIPRIITEQTKFRCINTVFFKN